MKYKGYIIKKSRFGGYWVFNNKDDAAKGQRALFGSSLAHCKKYIDSITGAVKGEYNARIS